MNSRIVKSATSVKSENSTSKKILGIFGGESADAAITNKNGLDITREVWTNVFNSDDYKQAIELGWYIGFLGHPEDPNCMDFEHACIVMTEGHIADNDKVYGKFNLIDTPVGRIVKAFIDAGVKFGISVRGAGDIVDNSVDPDTFVFRGFDLVTFPAYPDAIPEFTEVAASTDIAAQKKYKILCSAIKDNIDEIDDVDTLNILQSKFAKQSEPYQTIEDKKQAILGEDESEDTEALQQEKLECMTKLYLNQVKATNAVLKKLAAVRASARSNATKCDNRIRSIRRITASQTELLNSQYMEDCDNLRSQVKSCEATIASLETKLQASEQLNLKYKQKIESSQNTIADKDSVIASLREQANETVVAETDARISNLDKCNQSLKAEIKAAYKMLAEYQDAYAILYANALGVNLNNSVSVNASTSVADLQRLISATNTVNISAAPELTDDLIDYSEIADEDDNGDELVTM